MSWSNVYYNPTEVGATVVGEIDMGGSYEFDIFLVLRSEATGKLYCATDSGCSCPTPFEDHSFSDDFRHLFSLAEFDQALADWHAKPPIEEVTELRRKVREAGLR
jgi:hypothetical protein